MMELFNDLICKINPTIEDLHDLISDSIIQQLSPLISHPYSLAIA